MSNSKEYRLHGWDDEKIYLWSDKDKREYCVSDEEELYNRLLKICIEYFEKQRRESND